MTIHGISDSEAGTSPARATADRTALDASAGASAPRPHQGPPPLGPGDSTSDDPPRSSGPADPPPPSHRFAGCTRCDRGGAPEGSTTTAPGSHAVAAPPRSG